MPSELLPTTVGVELEMSNSANVGRDVAAVRDRAVREHLEGWVVKTDGSCGRTGAGVELNSPILKSIDDLRQVIRVCAMLRRLGFKTTERCGLHVHVDVRKLTSAQRDTFIRFFVHWENAIYLLDPSRRNSSYCRPLEPEIVSNIAAGQGWNSWSCRYRWMNGRAFSEHGTVEFRIMEGTLDDAHILGWVSFLLYVYSQVVSGNIAKSSLEKAANPDKVGLFESMMTAVGFDQSPRARAAKLWASRRFEQVNANEGLDRIRAERRTLRLRAWRGEVKFVPLFARPVLGSSSELIADVVG